MIKNLTKVIVVLSIGGLGGFFFQVFVFPYLINVPFFGNFQFVEEFKEREVNVYPIEEIVIKENKALQESIKNIEKAVVGIRTTTLQGFSLEGSGVIITSDGLLVTLSELIPLNSNFEVFINGEILEGEIVKREGELVLVRVEKRGLPTLSFADTDVNLGERVFLMGIFFNEEIRRKVNEGIVRFVGENYIETNISENLKGSPLFNIEGSIFGLNKVVENRIVSIPAERIREFAGF